MAERITGCDVWAARGGAVLHPPAPPRLFGSVRSAARDGAALGRYVRDALAGKAGTYLHRVAGAGVFAARAAHGPQPMAMAVS